MGDGAATTKHEVRRPFPVEWAVTPDVGLPSPMTQGTVDGCRRCPVTAFPGVAIGVSLGQFAAFVFGPCGQLVVVDVLGGFRVFVVVRVYFFGRSQHIVEGGFIVWASHPTQMPRPIRFETPHEVTAQRLLRAG